VLVLAAVLSVNLAALGWLALRRPATAPAPAGAPPQALQPAPLQGAAPAPGVGQGWPASAGAAAAPVAGTDARSQAVPTAAAPPAREPAAAQESAVQARAAQEPVAASLTGAAAPAADRAAGEPGQPAAGTRRDDDDAPAVEPESGATPALRDSAAGGDAGARAPAAQAGAEATTANGVPTLNTLPTYQQLAGSGSKLPDLKLDLHAYARSRAERFVMINMTRLQEGDSLPSGVRVDAITPDGVVLSYQGQQFLLPRP